MDVLVHDDCIISSELSSSFSDIENKDEKHKFYLSSEFFSKQIKKAEEAKDICVIYIKGERVGTLYVVGLPLNDNCKCIDFQFEMKGEFKKKFDDFILCNDFKSDVFCTVLSDTIYCGSFVNALRFNVETSDVIKKYLNSFKSCMSEILESSQNFCCLYHKVFGY